MKFDELIKLQEQPIQYILTPEGKVLIEQYNKLVDSLKLFIDEKNLMALISRLDTDNIGNKKYKIAKKISTILGRDGTIDASMWSISPNDIEMRQYVTEK